jgi:hypothetical protein
MDRWDEKMIKRYNNLSFLFFLPGIVAQIAGGILLQNHDPSEPMGILALALMVVGTLLAIAGFGYYALAKGRSPFFGLLGFIGVPGLLLLAVLKDRSGDPWNT